MDILFIAEKSLHRSKGFFCFSPHPTSEQGIGRGHSRGGIPQTTWHHIQQWNGGKMKEDKGTFRVMAFFFPSHHYVMEPCLLSYGWTPACTWGGNEFLLLLCLHIYLLNCYYLCPGVFSSLPIWFSPPSHGEQWERGCVGFSCWLGLHHDTAFSLHWYEWRFLSSPFQKTYNFIKLESCTAMDQ